jgi:hypothetical protein
MWRRELWGFYSLFVLVISADKKVNGSNKIPAKHKYLFIKTPL